mgnify:FL=1
MTKGKNIPLLRLLNFLPFLRPVVRLFFRKTYPSLKKEIIGLTFSGPVGVAAGVDKRGEYPDTIACYSPSFIEIGPIRDVRFAIQNLQQREEDIVVLANLSNAQNIERVFSLIYDFVDAIVLNVSHGSTVSKVIEHLLELRRYNDTYKPIIFKLFSDLSQAETEEVADYMLRSGIDAVMIGAEAVQMIREKTHSLMPVIAIAEISTPERAAQMLDTGADLIAVTNSPFHYGPKFIKRINKYLEKR